MINDTFEILNLQQRRITTPLFKNAKQAFIALSSSQKYHAKYLVVDSSTRLSQKIFMQSNICPVFIYSNKSYIFQEGQSLHEYFLSKKQSDMVLYQEQIWKMLQQIVRALILLRQAGYEHRHIKQYAIRRINADNYKLVFHPTIALPQHLIEQRTYNWYNFYLAPEQLDNLYNEESTTCVFSLGCLVLNVMNPLDFRRDIYSRSQFAINERILDQKLENAGRIYSKKILQIIKSMLAEDFSERPTLYQLSNLVQKASPFNKKIEMTSSLKSLVNYKLSKSKEKISSPPKALPDHIENGHKMKKSSKNKALEINFQRGTFGGKRQESSNQKQQKSNGDFDTTVTKEMLIKNSSKDLQLKGEESHQVQTTKRSFSEYFKDSKIKQLNKKDNSVKQKLGKQINQGLSITQSKGHIKLGITINQSQEPIGYNQYIIQTADKKKIKVGVSREDFQPPKKQQIQKTTTFWKKDEQQQVQEKPYQFQQASKNIQKQKKWINSKVSEPQLSSQTEKVEHSVKLFNSKVESYRLKLAQCLDQPMTIAKKINHPGVWINGNVYFGEFKNGRRNGLALEIFQNKEYYYGYFHDDMFHGEGFYYWNAHQHFLGIFQDGCKKQGTWWGKNKYTGEIKDNKRHGIGSYFYSNGKIYEGEWFMGKRHGSGIIVQPSGQKFVGTFKMGNKWGAGCYLIDDFRINGVWDGQTAVDKVQIIYDNGRSYKGFINEHLQMHGQGEYRFANGTICRGQFEFGDFVFGEMFYENGEKYVGEVKDYKRHGQGVYTYNNGREVTAEWDNNKSVRIIQH